MNSSYNLKKAVTYCSKNIRSKSEVLLKLKDWGISEEEKITILDFLKSHNFYQEDANYLDKYLENLSTVKGYSKIQLKVKLLKKGIPSKLIDEKLNSYFKENEDAELIKFIKKNQKKIVSRPRENRVKYLLSRGFKYNLIIKHLNIIDL